MTYQPRIVTPAKKTLLYIIFLLAGLFVFMNINTGSAEAASSCGVNSHSYHDYAGMIINVVYRDWETRGTSSQFRNADSGAIKITTKSPTSTPGGNVVKLGNGPEGVIERRVTQTFDQIDNGCVYRGNDGYPHDTKNVVLGSFGTSHPSGSSSSNQPWALDCDWSKHNDHFQKFEVTGVGHPSGTRAGGNWSTATIDPANGYTGYITIIYFEPPPSQPPNFDMDITCNAVRLRNVSDPDVPNTELRYRIWRGNGSGGKVQLVREGYVNTDKNVSISPSSNQQYIVKLFGKNKKGVEDGIDREKQSNAPSNCGKTDGRCNAIWFTVPNDSKALSPSNQWNTPNGQSYYAVYVNDWGSPGRPVPAGSPDYYPNGSGSPAGSGKYNNAPGPWVDYSSYDNPNSETVASGTFIKRNLREHNKVASGQLVWTLVVYDWFKNSSGVWRIQVQYRQTNVVDNCWQATCDIQIYGNVPGREGWGSNAVKGGSVIQGVVRVHNTGINNLPPWMITNYGNFGLSLTTNYRGGLSPNILGENIPPGGTIERPLEAFNFVALNDVGKHRLSLYPDYWGRAPLATYGTTPWCDADFQTFKQFSLDLTANTTLSPTREDPSVSQHRATIGPGITPVSVKVPYKAQSTLNGSILDSVDTSGYTTIKYLYDKTSFPNLRAGDEYCTYIYTPNSSGWVGPDNQLSDANDPSSLTICDTIHDRPFVSIYSGDAVAGVGGFYDAESGSCSTSKDGIRTYTNVSGSKGGSGSQLAAISNGEISGFTSASMTAAPLNLKLSFANTVNNAGGGDNQNNMGGLFNQNSCITNYFDATQYELGPNKEEETYNPTTGVQPDHLSAPQTVYETAASEKVNIQGAKKYKGRHTIYVDGDVIIKHDIIYKPWSNIEDIPNFTVVAKGNIYITRGVTQLDGVYIAQPRTPGDTGSGNVYTCIHEDAAEPYSSEDIDKFCDSQLTIYGSLIAERMAFHRTYKTLRESKARDDYPGLSIAERIQESPAAEKIIHSPELYLSPPIFNTPGSSSDSNLSIGIYEYITTLPPIL